MISFTILYRADDDLLAVYLLASSTDLIFNLPRFPPRLFCGRLAADVVKLWSYLYNGCVTHTHPHTHSIGLTQMQCVSHETNTHTPVAATINYVTLIVETPMGRLKVNKAAATSYETCKGRCTIDRTNSQNCSNLYTCQIEENRLILARKTSSRIDSNISGRVT